VWAFGPGSDGPNVLLDDTLSTDVDKGLLNAVRGSVVQVGRAGVGSEGWAWGQEGTSVSRLALPRLPSAQSVPRR
jgi:hypothetical protein